MRIIAGEFKRRTLKAPTWEGLRPTSDKVRETLFNLIAARVPGARLLDVFAGTGAVGLEGLSRGAARAVFVEADRRAAALIAENAARCAVRDRCVIIRDTAERALQKPIAGDPFDVIILDPPYEFERVAAVLAAAPPHLAPGGVVVLEHARRHAVAAVAGLRSMRTVRSGDSALTLFEAA